jgi:hypothetical protein
MAEIRIKIGASVDRGLENAFRPLEESAKRAKRTLRTEFDASAKEQLKAQQKADREMAKSARDAAREQAKAAREAAAQKTKAERDAAKEAARLDRERVRTAERAERDIVRAKEKAEREKAELTKKAQREEERAQRDAVRAAEKAAKDQARAIARQQREQIRATHQAERDHRRQSRADHYDRMLASRNVGRTVDNIVTPAARLGGKGLSFAKGVLSDVAQGAGADFSLASHVQKNVSLEKNATDLTNAGYMPGEKGQAGIRQDPQALIRDVRKAADATATDANVAMEGLQKFVAKTGDLQTGREIIQDLAKYSRATGAELDDMADAAGDVASALGETDNKGEKVKAVMKAIAAQGKVGAVEIKDLATQMAKIGASATQFTGDGAENVAKMAAISQAARQKGGAASATQAAQSTMGFMATFSKAARQNQFKAYGVNIRAADGKVADPKQIIMDSIAAAASEKHGGMANFDKNMGKMFMDSSSKRATRGFEAVYKDTKGTHEQKMEAVSKYFDKLANATMSETEVMESFTRSMSTTEAQAQLVNNQLSAAAQELQNSLRPAMAGMAPVMIQGTKAVTDWIGMLTGIKAQMSQAAGYRTSNESGNARRLLEGDTSNGVVGQNYDVAVSKQKALQDAIAAKEAEHKKNILQDEGKQKLSLANPMGDVGAALFDKFTGRTEARKKNLDTEREDLRLMREENDKMTKALEGVRRGLLEGTLKVEVVNQPTPGPPGAPTSGRSTQTQTTP